MRTSYDFIPFFRSSVGFDRVFDQLEHTGSAETFETWSPYDIVGTGEDSYRIVMAVVGFASGELKLTHQPNLLIVSGAKANYPYRGIADGRFERRFELPDFIEVADAHLENGILTISLKRELPVTMNPRKIAIASGTWTQPAARPIRVEQKQAA